MDKAYVAAPIFNKEQLEVVRGITMALVLLEYEYFSPYEASQEIWKGRAPKDCSQEDRDAVLRGNIDNLSWAQLLIAWVGGTKDGKTDTGVVWEMGHFNALSLLDASSSFTLAYIHPFDKRQHMNLMLAGTVNALAYGPAQLHKALELLRKDEFDKVCDYFDPAKHILHEKDPVG